MEEPPFQYPEDTLSGAIERLAFYRTRALNAILEEMARLGAWFKALIRWLDADD